VGLLEGDRLLLCSDGLTGMLTEEQVQAILEATPPAQEAADRLVRAANNAGGVDNITVVVLDVREGESEDEADGRATVVPSVAARPEPAADRPGRRRWLRIGMIAGIVIIVVGAGLAAFRAYLDDQWYVGEANGHVAIYQGVPVSVLGYDLSRVNIEYNDISADAAKQLPEYTSLDEGINANSYDDAVGIVDNIRLTIRKAKHSVGGG